jgi:ABC-type transport system involved in multi-copper enzyme maturation permease subunit
MSDVIDVVRAQLFSLVRRPAAWTVLAAAVVLSGVFGYLIPYLSYRSAEPGALDGAPPEALLASVGTDQVVANALGGLPVFAGALALVLGALVVGGEYAAGTVKTLLTQRPSRGAAITGQLVSLVLAVGVGVLVLFMMGGLASTAIALAEGQQVQLPGPVDLLAGYAVGVLILTMWASVGATLAVLLRGVALPIGLGVVWVLGVENLVSAMAENVLTALRPLRDLLPGVNSGSLADAVMPQLPRGIEPPPGINTSVAEGRALVTLLCIVAFCAVLSWWTWRRRDVV